MERFVALREEMRAGDIAWTERLRVQWMTDDADPVLVQLDQIMNEIAERESERKQLLNVPIALADGAELNEDFNDALTRLTQGKSAFVLPFGKKETREIIAAISVVGVKPS